MPLRLQHVVFDCARPDQLVVFWSHALGRAIDDGVSEHFAAIGMTPAPDGQQPHEPALLFQKVPEGKTGKNRVHIDLHGHDRETDVQRLIQLGATRLTDKDEWGTRWTVLQDPEGNEFCIA